MHTIYCDGKNTPEQMVISAIDKGMECIGFSGHSYVEFDPECGMDERHAALYYEEIHHLKETYRDRIRIYCGIEKDDCSAAETADYDYVIGSVHYLRVKPDQVKNGSILKSGAWTADNKLMHDGTYIYASVDDTPEKLMQAVELLFDHDYYSAAENYYEALACVVQRTGADIIGHFDLISKFNEKYRLFDEQHPRYIAAWQKAADALIPEGKVFEINTGAMARNWKSRPYPSDGMIEYIRRKGGRFILSGDSHSTENIAFGFTECKV